MGKKKIIRRGNKPLNIFDVGGHLNSPPIKGIDVQGKVPTQALNDKIPIQSGNASSGLSMGALSNMGAAVGQGINTAFNNAQIGDTSNIEDIIDMQNNTSVQASSNDELMNEWGSWSKVKDNYNWRDIRGKNLKQGALDTFNASGQGAMAFSSLGPIGAVAGGIGGLVSGLTGWLVGNRKAKRKANRLNQAASEANNRAIASFDLRADNLDKQSDFNIMSNYAAYGGFLPTSAIGYELSNQELNNEYINNMSKLKITSLPNSFEADNAFSKGGEIHIKKKNRGKFTQYCGGKVTNACIQKGLHSSNPTTRKRANFARNARKWHADGGPLDREYYTIMEKVANENYKNWGFSNPDQALVHALNDNTYDYKGYYSKYPQSNANSETHWTDEFKTVYHPTFSDESVYSNKKSEFNPEGLKGGHWFGEQFIPSKWQKKKALGGLLDVNITQESTPSNLTNGGVFSNGVTFVDEGDTHEGNPLGGVPMGISPDNSPNLVEEGEVVFNDYVFSNRLHITKNLAKKYNLPSKYINYSFAKAAESTNKESEERPNDPISKRGLLSGLSKLMQVQEDVRSQRETNKFDQGGHKPYKNYTPISDDWYTNEYMRFVNNLNSEDPMSMGWMNRINNEEFGSVGGNTFDIPNIKRLAIDRKRGPIHNALFQATKSDLSQHTPYLTAPTYRQDPNLVSPQSLTPAPRIPDQSYIQKEQDDQGQRESSLGLEDLRYAPVVGAGINSLTDLVGLTNRPDYGSSDMILNSVSSLPDIQAEPIGNYLAYNPFDRDYYINKLNAQSSSSRRDIQNTSGGNRAQAQAGILASDYNYGQNLGDLARKAEEYNLGQRREVEGFNRGTNQYNSEARMRAAMANQSNRQLQIEGVARAAALRDEAKRRSAAARSANLTNFFDSLGDIGREEFSRNMIDSNPALQYTIDRKGKVKYKKKKQDGSI